MGNSGGRNIKPSLSILGPVMFIPRRFNNGNLIRQAFASSNYTFRCSYLLLMSLLCTELFKTRFASYDSRLQQDRKAAKSPSPNFQNCKALYYQMLCYTKHLLPPTNYNISKGAVTTGNFSCNLSRKFVATKVARKIAWCNITLK